MAKRYEPKVLEPKWQEQWAKDRIYEVTEDASKKKIYATPMLPYPSGTGLHTGHVRNYSITDAVARFHRQLGFNTMSNIAWDAFGLPAENFAIKTGTPPAKSTAENIAYFKSQLQRLGMSYAWEREFNTSDPSYYKWTQWVFSIMYERGLAYQAEKSQWWCEGCKTVLADEQVIAGKCWRHDSPGDPSVKKRNVTQWFFKITDYADRILENTDSLDWPEKIKTMQKNWIGKSKGAEVQFKVDGSDDVITVFTTRPDTLFGATFLVLAPEHELVNSLTTTDKKAEVEAYQSEASKKDEIERQASKDKTGVFTGAYAVNPINGEKIPVWIADYVLAGYGTGAIMAVPAHDERDNEFAQKYNLSITQVVAKFFPADPGNELKDSADTETRHNVVVALKHWSEDKYLCLDWKTKGWKSFITGGVDDGEPVETAAIREIAEETGYTDVEIVDIGEEYHTSFYAPHKEVNRYMKATIVTAKLRSDASKPVDESESAEHTPVWVEASKLVDYVNLTNHKYQAELLHSSNAFSDEGVLINSGEYDGMASSEAREKIVAALNKSRAGEEKTTYKIRDWLISRQRYWGAPVPIIHCPDHGAVLVPQKDLPVVLPHVENYAPDGTNHSVLAGVGEWVNAPCPTCGKPAKRETDIMDGYVCSTWYTHRYADAHNDEVAFDPKKVDYWFPMDFYFGGDHAVAHLLYIRFFNLVLVDMGLMSEDKKEPIKRLVYNGYINAEDGSKMSKSKGNTVDPMDIINSGYGADALRVFELFIAPYDQDTSWNTNGVPGTYRFLQRVWNLVQDYVESNNSVAGLHEEEILKVSHKTVKKVTQDLEQLSFNTAVAAMMGLTNELHLAKAKEPITKSVAWTYALESIIQLLGPFAPHIAEEMWHDLGHNGSVHVGHWPSWDEKYLISDTVKYAVQVNGKLRGEVEVSSDADQETVVSAARANEKVASYVTGDPKKVIFVKGKLVSFVV